MNDSLSREQVERIVRRAIELDATQSRRGDTGLSVDAIIDAADEMGVSRAAVVEAVAIERLGEVPEDRAFDRLFGSAVVVYERKLALPASDALQLTDEWLTSAHHLRREQLDGHSGVWRKRSDVAASAQRWAKSIAGGAGLGEVRRIDVVVGGVDADASIVRMLADRRVERATGMAIGASATVGSGVAAGMAVAAATPVAVVALPGLVVAGAAAGLTRHGGTKLHRELMHLLDRLAAGDEVPRLGSGVARRLGLRAP